MEDYNDKLRAVGGSCKFFQPPTYPNYATTTLSCKHSVSSPPSSSILNVTRSEDGSTKEQVNGDCINVACRSPVSIKSSGYCVMTSENFGTNNVVVECKVASFTPTTSSTENVSLDNIKDLYDEDIIDGFSFRSFETRFLIDVSCGERLTFVRYRYIFCRLRTMRRIFCSKFRDF